MRDRPRAATAAWLLPLAGGALLAALLTSSELQAQTPATQDAQRGRAYKPPRTPWGDPDLQGKWPSTHMVGVPMQRDERFGTRNELTDEEFTERQAQFARQQDIDLADFELEDAANSSGWATRAAASRDAR